ncbi:hypothetical protein [Aquimarina agarilytica]|uniref:hypothetical protein n=1 Tax=Aquimarina agarilytica TaxID=1087449 RepID=UPI000289AD08|nr:hypothetical protein [Aquimarina agarilytica]
MNSKKLFGISLFLIGIFSTYSQENTQQTNFWDNVRYGGSLGLDFSNNVTSVIVSPSAVYQFNPKFSAGAGINFGYTRFKRNDVNQYNYGASLISLYNPITALQLSAELEQTFVNSSATIAGEKIKNNFNFPALYLGAGYRLGNVAIGARYDVLYKENRSIYASAISPFARVYF